jgi:hypothetical protein
MVEIKQETKDKVKQTMNKAKTWCQEHAIVVAAAGIIIGGECIKHTLKSKEKDKTTDLLSYDDDVVLDILRTSDKVAYAKPSNLCYYTKADVLTIVKEHLMETEPEVSDTDRVTGVLIAYKEK